MFDKWAHIQNQEYQAGQEKHKASGSYFGYFSVPEFYITDEIANRLGEINGPVLDIGCGILPMPNYLKECKRPYGIDPYLGSHRRFPFCQALGENIPFRNNSFVAVLFMSSLDHVINPQIVVDESYRVLLDGGELFIWYINRDKLDSHHSQIINRQMIADLTAGKFIQSELHSYKADRRVGFPRTEMVGMRKI